MILNSKQAMRLALQQAKKGVGWAEPNPPVGCVILDFKYNLLATGYHKKYGLDHAEVSALKKIKDKTKLKKARVFVTLEPCHHEGKTPSCAKALAQFPIYSLCYGAEDPFTKGRGLNYLKEKKIKIIKSYDFQQEIENLLAPFKFSFLHKQAFVSLKVAVSLDGQMAHKPTDTGFSTVLTTVTPKQAQPALEDSRACHKDLQHPQSKANQWITGPKAREHARALRAEHSAVLIGVNTFFKDKPRLDIRLKAYKGKTNKVIILDPKGKSLPFLPQSALLKAHSADQVIIVCADKPQARAHQEKGTQLAGVKVKFFKTFKTNTSPKPCLDLPQMLKALYQEENIPSVLVEGGSFCLSQFLWQKQAQRLYLYIAPKIIGQGLCWSGNFRIPRLSQSLKLHSIEWERIGEDLCLSGFF